MNRISQFYRDLTLRPQGMTLVIAAFLPIIAIVAMGPAVPSMIQHFASDPDARKDVPAMIGAMLVMNGTWNKPGVWNMEQFDPDPFMEELNKWGLPWEEDFNPVLVD